MNVEPLSKMSAQHILLQSSWRHHRNILSLFFIKVSFRLHTAINLITKGLFFLWHFNNDGAVALIKDAPRAVDAVLAVAEAADEVVVAAVQLKNTFIHQSL